tara:strand:+ start:291 stop:818 length:528 start_codon:yes stop_codon:yes gene_type:complete
MTESTSLKFWHFSLAYYQHSNSSEILLSLQNTHGLDINLILFALWTGRVEGTALLKEDFQALDSSIANWRQNIIQPIRKLRQTAKAQANLFSDFSENFLSMTSDTELESERICQVILCQKYLNLTNLSKNSKEKGLAILNLGNYFSLRALPNSSNLIKIKHKLVNFAEEILTQSP